jgi:hypothetical protein
MIEKACGKTLNDKQRRTLLLYYSNQLSLITTTGVDQKGAQTLVKLCASVVQSTSRRVMMDASGWLFDGLLSDGRGQATSQLHIVLSCEGRVCVGKVYDEEHEAIARHEYKMLQLVKTTVDCGMVADPLALVELGKRTALICQSMRCPSARFSFTCRFYPQKSFALWECVLSEGLRGACGAGCYLRSQARQHVPDCRGESEMCAD